MESGNDDHTLGDEEAAHVATCRQVYEEEKARLGPGVTELSEIYLSVDAEDTTAGYIDSALINAVGDFAVLLDYKFGMHKVPHAKENLQIQAYVLGLFRAYPLLDRVKAMIVQPTVDSTTEHTYGREEIPELHAKICAIVSRAKAARTAGDFSMARAAYPLCSFCKNIAICPVVTKLAGEAGHKFSPLSVPPDITPMQIHDAANTKLGWQLSQTLEVWCKAFRQVITDRVLSMRADPPEGYKLVSRSKREIVDAAKYRNVALRRLTVEQYESTLKPSLTAVEDLISKEAPRGSKTAAVESFSEELEAEGAVKAGELFAFLQAVKNKPSAEDAEKRSKAWAAEQRATAPQERTE